MIFEDLHWIDAETQALLDLLAESVARARVLLLVNHRPEYRHNWAGKSHYLQIRLDPLGTRNTAYMLSALLGEGDELAPVKRLIADRTGGNPFFIEEIVQELFDEDVLVRNGTVKIARALTQLRLPPTVQGILDARIDRLTAGQKELLQTLAVMGRQSPLGLIRKVAGGSEPQLQRMLADLQASGFIHEQPAIAGVEYVFKHALTQEVAFVSLLNEQPKLLHDRVGQAVEALYAGYLDDHLGDLAYHFTHGANPDKAVRVPDTGRQTIAGAFRIHRIRNAVCSEALDLIKALPESLERDATRTRAREHAGARDVHHPQGLHRVRNDRGERGRAREIGREER